jgi:hypothetical protein
LFTRLQDLAHVMGEHEDRSPRKSTWTRKPPPVGSTSPAPVGARTGARTPRSVWVPF